MTKPAIATCNQDDDLKRKKEVYCLALLRAARSLILRDAESFHEAATVLETIAKIAGGKIEKVMVKYDNQLLKICLESGRSTEVRAKRLLGVVREARNMAVHEGAWARHLSSRLIDLFLILEEAIMKNLQFVEDIMVRNPVVVESWHMVAQVRREMLANSFSCLPIYHRQKWLVITDSEVMRYLHCDRSSRGELDRRLEKNIGNAIDGNQIKTISAKRCSPSELIPNLLGKIKNGPILVIEKIKNKPLLVGIVTPFDLL